MQTLGRAPGQDVTLTPSLRGETGVNVLKPHLQTTIATLLAKGASQRKIERVTGIDRKTIRAYQQRLTEERANSPGVATGSAEQIPPPWPPAWAVGVASACEPHREFIETQVRAAPQRDGDLPRPRGPVRVRREVQQRQALRAPAVRDGA